MGARWKLHELAFDNRYARLPPEFHAPARPTPLANQRLVAFNPDAAELLDLDPDEVVQPEFIESLTGLRPLPGSEPVAMRYAGHQFGHYVPQLGDGRALLLGEVVNKAGERWDLHLKGCGPTPFSREDDGRAVLRSAIREYLCSEAMHGLGIPTSRALCIVGSDEPVLRETVEPGAMLLRLAPSHVRFGSFEVFYYRRQHEHVRLLADHVIAHHYPHLAGAPPREGELLRETARRTARLIAQWQAVGFCHGVLNSDNMSILGITLDYGPFGFMEAYRPGWICNHSDRHGRYAFQNQPDIGYFNLRCLAEALSPFVPREEARAILDEYEVLFTETYLALMRAKLGLETAREGDTALIGDFLDLLQAGRVDYTRAFRALCGFRAAPGAPNDAIRGLFAPPATFDAWVARYRARLLAEGDDEEARAARMRRANPKYVLRNYLAQVAIRRAVEQQDFSEIERLRRLLRDPFAEQPEMEAYAAAPPDWAETIVVSCSS